MNESEHISCFFTIFVIYMFHSVSFGYVLASFCELPAIAAIMNPFFDTMLLLLNGIFLPSKSMSAFWSS